MGEYKSTNRRSLADLLKLCEGNAEQCRAVCFRALVRGNYEAALLFAGSWAEAAPDEYLPLHARFIALFLKGEKEEAWKLLLEQASQFGEDALYIDDKGLYLHTYAGAEDTRRYLREKARSAAGGTQVFLMLQSCVFGSDRDPEKLIPVLERLSEEYGDKGAQFKIGMLSVMEGEYQKAREAFRKITSEEEFVEGTFFALCMDAFCAYSLKEADWERQVAEAAEKIDRWSVLGLRLMPLRELSTPLWELLGNSKKVEENKGFVEEVRRFFQAPSVLEYLEKPAQ